MTSSTAKAIRRLSVLQELRDHKPQLQTRFGVQRLRLFGSVGRDTAHLHSDIDLLVTFHGPVDADRYFGTLFYLEDLLGEPVDLVTEQSLRPELRPYIDGEAIEI